MCPAKNTTSARTGPRSSAYGSRNAIVKTVVGPIIRTFGSSSAESGTVHTAPCGEPLR